MIDLNAFPLLDGVFVPDFVFIDFVWIQIVESILFRFHFALRLIVSISKNHKEHRNKERESLLK